MTRARSAARQRARARGPCGPGGRPRREVQFNHPTPPQNFSSTAAHLETYVTSDIDDMFSDLAADMHSLRRSVDELRVLLDSILEVLVK